MIITCHISYTISILSPNLKTFYNLMWLSPFWRCSHWDPERLFNLPQVTQPECWSDPSACLLWSQCLFHCLAVGGLVSVSCWRSFQRNTRFHFWPQGMNRILNSHILTVLMAFPSKPASSHSSLCQEPFIHHKHLSQTPGGHDSHCVPSTWPLGGRHLVHNSLLNETCLPPSLRVQVTWQETETTPVYVSSGLSPFSCKATWGLHPNTLSNPNHLP